MTGLLICVFLIMGSMAVWADQTGAVSPSAEKTQKWM